MVDTLPAEAAYYPGEFLTQQDYADEQGFQLGMQRLGAAALNTWGIVQGLGVTPAANELTIADGWAIDGRGRLIVQPSPRQMALPPSAMGAAWLTVAFSEVAAPGLLGAPSYVMEAADFAWWAQAQDFDPSVHLVLGQYMPGGAPVFTAAGRRYAGANAGTVTLVNRLGGEAPSIVGWNDETRVGLRINAPVVRLSAFNGQAGGALLSVTDGYLGVGVMSPAAALDVQGPNVALTGPGTITSMGVLVRGDSEALATALHLGDILLVTDRQGAPRQSRIVQITPQGDILTELPLNCDNAPFLFQRALLVSVRNASDASALSIDRDGQVGFGVTFPLAQLHVGGGDLEIAGVGDGLVRFAGDGAVSSLDGTSRLSFITETPKLEIRQDGAVQWLPGRGATPQPVGMILTEDGAVGIGTTSPTAPLDVDGVIFSTSGGFVFPDGSVQATAEAGVPIGTVIDWWRGQTDVEPPLNYQICDGSIVDDTTSPFHGKAVPNLADCFIVGLADPTKAGETSGADAHQHGYNVPSHTHPYQHSHPQISGAETGQANQNDGMAGSSDNNAQKEHKHLFTATIGMQSEQETTANSDAGQAAQTGSSLLTPPYVGLLKLIRIS